MKIFGFSICTVKPEKIEEFKELAAYMIEKTKEEEAYKEGKIHSYCLVQEVGKENVFAFPECWDNINVVMAHKDYEHFKVWCEKAPDMLIGGKPNLTRYEVILE